jgi:phage shock protein B
MGTLVMGTLFWILLVIFGVIALIVALVWICGKAIYSLLSSKDKETNSEDARLLQELNTRLSKLEKRIETLETIVTASENPPRA